MKLSSSEEARLGKSIVAISTQTWNKMEQMEQMEQVFQTWNKMEQMEQMELLVLL